MKVWCTFWLTNKMELIVTSDIIPCSMLQVYFGTFFSQWVWLPHLPKLTGHWGSITPSKLRFVQRVSKCSYPHSISWKACHKLICLIIRDWSQISLNFECYFKKIQDICSLHFFQLFCMNPKLWPKFPCSS